MTRESFNTDKITSCTGQCTITRATVSERDRYSNINNSKTININICEIRRARNWYEPKFRAANTVSASFSKIHIKIF